MTEFRPIIVSILLLGLFVVAIFSFGVSVANLNNPDQSIGNDPAIAQYIANINATLDTAEENANSAEDAIGTSPTTLSGGAVILDAIAGIWKTIKNVPTTIYYLTAGFITSKIFGGGAFAIVISVLGAILTITIVLAVWKLVIQGEGG